MISQQGWQAHEQDSSAFTLRVNVDKEPLKVTFNIINIDYQFYWTLPDWTTFLLKMLFLDHLMLQQEMI